MLQKPSKPLFDRRRYFEMVHSKLAINSPNPIIARLRQIGIRKSK